MAYQEDEEPMDVPAVLAALNEALSMMYRSALQYTVVSGSLFGLQYLALGAELRTYGESELADARRVVEKVAALGGTPTTYVTPFDWTGDPEAAVQGIVAAEQEAIDGLRAVIPHTGTEGRSEALEHLMEHLILRKQDQIDFLTRTSARPRRTGRALHRSTRRENPSVGTALTRACGHPPTVPVHDW
jgi:bacterioferritin (cytochrome b1)